MASHILSRLARALTARSRRALSPPDTTVAAVLVPLLVVESALHVLFTRRSAEHPHHRGQVAFPGGRRAADDPDLAHTALREAHEEVGIAPADVTLLGALDDLETVGSRFVITPWVGVVPHPYAWRPCPREVDAIFTVPLDSLRAPEAEREEVWDFGGRRIPVRHFPVDGHVIWGATHRITRNLLDLVDGTPPCAAS